MTTLEQLESVQAAIHKIESSGQVYSGGGSSVERARYESLIKRERELLARLERENMSHNMILGSFNHDGA